MNAIVQKSDDAGGTTAHARARRGGAARAAQQQRARRLFSSSFLDTRRQAISRVLSAITARHAMSLDVEYSVVVR